MAKIPKFTLDNERGTYEVRFYHRTGTDEKGKPIYIRPRLDTGLTNERLAEKKAKELIEDFLKGKVSPSGEKAQLPETIQLSPLLTVNTETYLRHFYVGKLSENTETSNRRALNYMIQYSPKGKDSRVAEITPKVAGDIWNTFCDTPTRLKRPPNEKGKAHFLRDVCAYWEWEVKVNKVPENPFGWITKPKDDEFDEYTTVWTQREYLDILERLAYAEDMEALQVCRWTGMYPKDVFMLTTDDCHIVKGTIVITKEREKRARKARRKKRSNQIIKFAANSACPEVEGLLMVAYARAKARGGGRMFCNHYPDNKSVLWVEQFGKRIKAAWEDAYPNTKHKSPKAFRHTRVTEWRKSGVDPEIIGNRVGHVKGSKMVLKIYSHLDELEDLSDELPASLFPNRI